MRGTFVVLRLRVNVHVLAVLILPHGCGSMRSNIAGAQISVFSLTRKPLPTDHTPQPPLIVKKAAM